MAALSRLGKEIKDKFALEANTLKRAVKDNPADRIELEIGDSKDADFQPQAKIMRWDNETNFSVRRKRVWNNPSVSTAGEKVRFIDTDEEVHIYELPDIGEDGGLELELHLKEKPATNRFEFSIETKGLDFFYQPALTQEEIDKGANRPENVIGSYAVYHKTRSGNVLGGKEYKTGKAFHIYRPHVTDATGKATWGELEIHEKTKELVVTVPQEFLDTAVYPVIVDPTFGYESIGATGQEWSSALLLALKATSGADAGTLDKITLHSSNAGPRSAKCGVYTRTGTGTDSLVAVSSAVLMNAVGWFDFTLGGEEITGSTNYYVGTRASAGAGIFLSYDSATAISAYNAADWTSSITWTTESYTWRISIYATYSVASSATDNAIMFAHNF